MIQSIKPLNHALQKADDWLQELTEFGHFHDDEQAYSALRAVLHAIRNRLIPDEAVAFGSEFPLLIRGIYFEDFDLRYPKRHASVDEFLNTISSEMRHLSFSLAPDQAAKIIFNYLKMKIRAGELRDVFDQLPRDIRNLVIEREEVY